MNDSVDLLQLQLCMITYIVSVTHLFFLCPANFARQRHYHGIPYASWWFVQNLGQNVQLRNSFMEMSIDARSLRTFKTRTTNKSDRG